MTFKKTLLAASLAAMSMAAVAQTNDASKDEVEAGASTEIALTGNLTLASSYRFRGLDQTWNQPAIQGGFDLSLPYGFYVGNWNSNVSSWSGYPGGNLETDLYGGWKYSFTEDVGTDIGVLEYLYPGSKQTDNLAGYAAGTKAGMVNNTEIYFGGNWKTVSLKQFFAVTDYFNAKGLNNSNTAGSGYTDLTATYDLGGIEPSLATWGVVAHAGYFYMKNYSAANYADWKLGITKDFGSGWNASASYIQASTNGNCSNDSSPQPYCLYKGNSNGSTSSMNQGHATYMITVGKTF